MATFRRIMILLLLVTVFFSFAVTACASEELVDEFILVPYGEYSCGYYEPENLSEFLFDVPVSQIDYEMPLNVHIDGILYQTYWTFCDDEEGYYFCGNGSWYEGLEDNGFPFYVTINGDRLYLAVRCEFSDSSACIEIYQGFREIIDLPGDSNDSLGAPDTIHDATISAMLGYVLGWWSICWHSFIWGPLSSLLPVFAIAVAIPLVFFVIKFIRQFLR